MSNLTTRKATAGLASGVLGVMAVVLMLAALMFGLGPTESGLDGMPDARIGAGR